MSLNQLLNGTTTTKPWCNLVANGIATKGIISDDTKVTTALPTAILGSDGKSGAAAGYVGEYVYSTASDVKTSAGIYINAASINLTPGDWDIRATGVFTGDGKTVELRMAISTESKNGSVNPPDTTEGVNLIIHDTPFDVTDGKLPFSIAPIGYLLTANTTIYLKAFVGVDTPNGSFSGIISARRMR